MCHFQNNTARALCLLGSVRRSTSKKSEKYACQCPSHSSYNDDGSFRKLYKWNYVFSNGRLECEVCHLRVVHASSFRCVVVRIFDEHPVQQKSRY